MHTPLKYSNSFALSLLGAGKLLSTVNSLFTNSSNRLSVYFQTGKA